MTRKLHISSYKNTFTVTETVRLGQRAVSPTYYTKEEAQAALSFLQQNPGVARVKRA